MVTIDQLVQIAAKVADKQIIIKHIPGPTGVKGRNSDNKLLRSTLNWEPAQPLEIGIMKTYKWIDEQLNG
jgi:nucleoside-diphosphate-sugar epimerase